MIFKHSIVHIVLVAFAKWPWLVPSVLAQVQQHVRSRPSNGGPLPPGGVHDLIHDSDVVYGILDSSSVGGGDVLGVTGLINGDGDEGNGDPSSSSVGSIKGTTSGFVSMLDDGLVSSSVGGLSRGGFGVNNSGDHGGLDSLSVDGSALSRDLDEGSGDHGDLDSLTVGVGGGGSIKGLDPSVVVGAGSSFKEAAASSSSESGLDTPSSFHSVAGTSIGSIGNMDDGLDPLSVSGLSREGDESSDNGVDSIKGEGSGSTIGVFDDGLDPLSRSARSISFMSVSSQINGASSVAGGIDSDRFAKGGVVVSDVAVDTLADSMDSSSAARGTGSARLETTLDDIGVESTPTDMSAVDIVVDVKNIETLKVATTRKLSKTSKAKSKPNSHSNLDNCINALTGVYTFNCCCDGGVYQATIDCVGHSCEYEEIEIASSTCEVKAAMKEASACRFLASFDARQVIDPHTCEMKQDTFIQGRYTDPKCDAFDDESFGSSVKDKHTIVVGLRFKRVRKDDLEITFLRADATPKQANTTSFDSERRVEAIRYSNNPDHGRYLTTRASDFEINFLSEMHSRRLDTKCISCLGECPPAEPNRFRMLEKGDSIETLDSSHRQLDGLSLNEKCSQQSEARIALKMVGIGLGFAAAVCCAPIGGPVLAYTIGNLVLGLGEETYAWAGCDDLEGGTIVQVDYVRINGMITKGIDEHIHKRAKTKYENYMKKLGNISLKVINSWCKGTIELHLTQFEGYREEIDLIELEENKVKALKLHAMLSIEIMNNYQHLISQELLQSNGGGCSGMIKNMLESVHKGLNHMNQVKTWYQAQKLQEDAKKPFDGTALGKHDPPRYGTVCSFLCVMGSSEGSRGSRGCVRNGRPSGYSKYQGWCDRNFPKQKHVEPSSMYDVYPFWHKDKLCAFMTGKCVPEAEDGYNMMKREMDDWFQNEFDKWWGPQQEYKKLFEGTNSIDESPITGDVGVSFYYEALVSLVKTNFMTSSQNLVRSCQECITTGGSLKEIANKADTVKEFIQNNPVCVVAFTNCPGVGSCKKSEPDLEKLAESSKVPFSAINAGLGLALIHFDVTVFPTYVLYVRGTEVERVEGAVLENVKKMISAYDGNTWCNFRPDSDLPDFLDLIGSSQFIPAPTPAPKPRPKPPVFDGEHSF